MQFSRIRLENWRNFSEVDVSLQTRAFIVGANASGKSNLLDAFRFLRDLVLPGGGLQKAVADRRGVSAIRNLAARGAKTSVIIEIELVDNDPTQWLWRYRIVFSQSSDRRALVREEKIWREGNPNPLLSRPDPDDEIDKERLSQTYLEQTFANRDFRDITDFFKSISYSHIVPHLVRDPERSVGRQSDPYGGDFLEQIAQADKRSQETRLKRVQEALKIAVPQLSSLELFRDVRGTPHLRGKYVHWRSKGAWQTETEFSDGTLRLIGLLWALQTGSGPILLEEPELSLHPGVVRYLPQMIQNVQRARKVGPRQIFISTHSNELLMDEGIAPDELLLLRASSEGTEAKLGADLVEIQHELQAGFTIAEIALAHTAPPDVPQLAILDL